MSTPPHASDTRTLDDAARDGPLPGLLLALTFVTGLVDAMSFLVLGNVFVANMTGNVLFLGFALASARDFSLLASALALASFLCGALAGGVIGTRAGRHRGRFLAIAILGKVLLVSGALAIAALTGIDGSGSKYALIALLALSMGLQTAAARRLAVADLTTTVLTQTLTGLAADSRLAGGAGTRAPRRLGSAATMLLGAAAGAWVALHVGLVAALALTLAILLASGLASLRTASSAAPWTVDARSG